jgi:hypothetical protein
MNGKPLFEFEAKQSTVTAYLEERQEMDIAVKMLEPTHSKEVIP